MSALKIGLFLSLVVGLTSACGGVTNPTGQGGNAGSGGTAGSGGAGATGGSGGATCDNIQCIRAIECVKECGGPVVSSGCCPCKPPTFDSISCRVDAGPPSICACLSAELAWGPNGGLVAYQDRSTIYPCKTYTHERTTFRVDEPSTTGCKAELPPCGVDALGIGDVNAALANKDVQAALKAAPVLYGRDLRPVDGTVFRISLGGKTIDVGSPCSAARDCRAIPAGVAALVEVLRALDKQELAKPACSSVFQP
jgi:hypothetical protein